MAAACRCTGPGQCSRAGVVMTRSLYRLCSGIGDDADLSERMREEWDRRAGVLKRPGLFARAKSFGRALARHVAAGCPTVPTEEQSRRLALCVVCPHYTAKGTCNLCGCRLKWKSAFSLEKCPIGKW